MRKLNLLITITVLVSLIVSCQVESTFRSKDIDALMKDLSSEYNQIEKTKVKKYPGGIIIYVYFTSTKNESIDEDLYGEFKTFFADSEVTQRISDKFGMSPSIVPNYPIITVDFIDSQEIESHDISASGYNDEYDDWSEPYYYNKGNYVTDKRASETTQEERKKRYADVLSTIMGNKYHTYVSVKYNYASLKDEHVVLRVTFNTEDQFLESTKSLWIDEYDEVLNLVVDEINWKSIMKSQTVKYFIDDSTESKYVFGVEKEQEGIISSHYFMLDKSKCENEIELIDNKEYNLLFTIDEPNEIISYIIKEIDDN